jgi:S-disulfanyl-L-cysteine oxidoreductase SoxD
MTAGPSWLRQAAFVIATVGFGTGVASSQSGGGPSKRSVWDGVYSEEQARRGENQYGRFCESCHGADLSGNQVDEVPALTWDAFLMQWNDRTVKDLFDSVKRSMPRDNPGSLNLRAYVDVIAYLLQANKFPSGAKDLSLNEDVLGQIVIERTKR